MELNGCANIDMAIQSYNAGYISKEELIEQIKEQNSLLMDYLKEIDKLLPKDSNLILWHDLKERVKSD